MVKSWNFIFWSWKSHGKVMEFCSASGAGTLVIITSEELLLSQGIGRA
jgi:hypothetical protein